jgi:hypothetical protein
MEFSLVLVLVIYLVNKTLISTTLIQVPLLSQKNPFHILSPSFFNIHFVVMLPSTLSSS